MTFDEIRIAIESRLVTWDGVPIAYDGVKNGPALQDAIDNNLPWVRLTILNGDSFTSEIGDSPRVRRPGVIVCQIFTPDNEGSAEAYRIADSLTDRLQYWTEGNLETLAASAQRVGPIGGYYQVNLNVPYRAHQYH